MRFLNFIDWTFKLYLPRTFRKRDGLLVAYKMSTIRILFSCTILAILVIISL